MKFSEIIDQASELLQRKGRMSYLALQLEFELSDKQLEALKVELIKGQRLAVDEDGDVLVWTGDETPEESVSQTADALAAESPASAQSLKAEREASTGERRQLTVMFCDLVGSTALSAQLDPEELQAVVRTYQEVSAQVIERYEGYIAQYLGDGLLVYFGYPAAHEDDAARAIHAGLEIVSALHQARSQFPQPVQVRIGIHAGPVVMGQMGGGSRHEQLALGETPNIAARVQGKAEPGEVVISAATQRLVAGLFETEDRGQHDLKGISTPQSLYRITAESLMQSRFEVAVQTGLTPLVGRDHELGILRERWTQAQAGNGQAVLVSGEPGIGKSRLGQEFKAQVTEEGATSIEFRCSPYHQNSALYPITEHLQRLLQFTRDETPETKLAKLQQTLTHYRFPQADTLPLLATLLSLPHPEGVSPLTVSPQKQKDLTYAALVAWLLEETEQQPVYTSWEDLHWADPSTLEVLALFLRQVPTTRLLAVLTFRPEFVPPWGRHSYLSQLTLSRLGQPQVNAMVERVTGGKAFPEEVLQQVVIKTDGVPLFVEELTKTILESGVVRAVNGHYELTGPLSSVAIPATLQDSLMARLDRMQTAKEVAQLGAVLGREFSYELLQAVSSFEETYVQESLRQLVAAELVYQRGIFPQAHYLFKHALVQDAAYQSLLKTKRQHLHRQIAQILEERFPDTIETQPELVAHHYTEGSCLEQSLPYWQRAGQRATARSANVEAVSHLRKGLALLKTLPETSVLAQHELSLQISLGAPLSIIGGYGSSDVGEAFARARELCRQIGETPQLFTVLRGLHGFYMARGELRTARELMEQLLTLAQRVQKTTLFLWAHCLAGETLSYMGEFVLAREHLRQSLTFYKSHTHRSYYGPHDPGVACLTNDALVMWYAGYPDQALTKIQEAITLGRDLMLPFSLARALHFAAVLHQHRREEQVAQEHAQATLTLSTEQGLSFYLEHGTILHGWALAAQGQGEEGIAQIRQGLDDYRVIGGELWRSYFLALLAESYKKMGQSDEGLSMLAEALTVADKRSERFYEAELYRLKGELLMQENQMSKVKGQMSKVEEAEVCFHNALDVARHQQAKSLELRAATSLARLWQQQGKRAEARELLTPIYNWFTEGFDTPDLKDAKALLAELGEGH